MAGSIGMKKIAVIVGHNERKQGAVRKDNGETEFAFNSRVAKVMQDLAEQVGGYAVKVFFRPPEGGYSQQIAQAYAGADAWGADVSMELHFNSFGDESANGCETLSSGTVKSLALAQEVNDQIVRTFGVRDRGIRTRASSERGGRSLFAGRAPAILTEPFFASNPSDLIKFAGAEAERRLAGAYLTGAIRALDGEQEKIFAEDAFDIIPEAPSRAAARAPIAPVAPAVEEVPAYERKYLWQSKTITAAVAWLGANGALVAQFWQNMSNFEKGLIALGLLAFFVIFSERINKWIEGDR